MNVRMVGAGAAVAALLVAATLVFFLVWIPVLRSQTAASPGLGNETGSGSGPVDEVLPVEEDSAALGRDLVVTLEDLDRSCGGVHRLIEVDFRSSECMKHLDAFFLDSVPGKQDFNLMSDVQYCLANNLCGYDENDCRHVGLDFRSPEEIKRLAVEDGQPTFRDLFRTPQTDAAMAASFLDGDCRAGLGDSWSDPPTGLAERCHVDASMRHALYIEACSEHRFGHLHNQSSHRGHGGENNFRSSLRFVETQLWPVERYRQVKRGLIRDAYRDAWAASKCAQFTVQSTWVPFMPGHPSFANLIAPPDRRLLDSQPFSEGNSVLESFRASLELAFIGRQAMESREAFQYRAALGKLLFVRSFSESQDRRLAQLGVEWAAAKAKPPFTGESRRSYDHFMQGRWPVMHALESLYRIRPGATSDVADRRLEQAKAAATETGLDLDWSRIEKFIEAKRSLKPEAWPQKLDIEKWDSEALLTKFISERVEMDPQACLAKDIWRSLWNENSEDSASATLTAPDNR